MDSDLINNTFEEVANWIGGEICLPTNNLWLKKFNPHTGLAYARVADSGLEDINRALGYAEESFPMWSQLSPVKRGIILEKFSNLMRLNINNLATIISKETGKSLVSACAEVNGAILLAEYFAGEGMRLFGQTLTSYSENKQTYTIREPHGVVALIVPANTPIANICWKIFPALICGNTIILKASENSPQVALEVAKLSKDAGLPDGVFNVLQGSGQRTGMSLVQADKIKLISFTGSSDTGRLIAQESIKDLKRLSLELGGKNPFIVCEDANIESAINYAVLSAYSNAGQRCSAGSKLIIFDKVYDSFKKGLISKINALKLGIKDGDDIGPVISRVQQEKILNMINRTRECGCSILTGGTIPQEDYLKNGYYILPTLVEDISDNEEICQEEIFGPVATLHKVQNIDQAIEHANSTKYGLTSAIHTSDISTAMLFTKRIRAGVVNINGATFGSEPHMPFGGFGHSGNGSREPGLEALNVYSELKVVSLLF